MTFTSSATGCFGVGAVESSVLFFVTVFGVESIVEVRSVGCSMCTVRCPEMT